MKIVVINSVDEFKAKVKVGDWLRGWATRRQVQVTAIGETRFLFRETVGRYTEAVGTMNPASCKWDLIIPESILTPQQPQVEATL